MSILSDYGANVLNSIHPYDVVGILLERERETGHLLIAGGGGGGGGGGYIFKKNILN